MQPLVPLLSFCITTRNRESYIGETLRSILSQCPPTVEVLVLDGASTDGTREVVKALVAEFAQLRLIESRENHGLDADFDACVMEARGRHCWLFSDDDVLVDGAVLKVLAAIEDDPTVVLVDGAVYGPDLTHCYESSRLPCKGQCEYGEDEGERFFEECGRHLSFIGSLIVRRAFWLSRERRAYYGSYYIHVGVLFQTPIPGIVRVLGVPLVKIRFGLASWSGRTFDILMYRWPSLIWSFDWLSDRAKQAVTPREPWRRWRRLLLMRAGNFYGLKQFREEVAPRARHRRHLAGPFVLSLVPGQVAYSLARAAVMLRNPNESTLAVLDRSPFRWPRLR